MQISDCKSKENRIKEILNYLKHIFILFVIAMKSLNCDKIVKMFNIFGKLINLKVHRNSFIDISCTVFEL